MAMMFDLLDKQEIIQRCKLAIDNLNYKNTEDTTTSSGKDSIMNSWRKNASRWNASVMFVFVLQHVIRSLMEMEWRS